MGTLADVDDPTPDYDYPVMYSLSYASPAPQPHFYMNSGSRQAYSPQSYIEPVIADSYDLAYDDTGSGFESYSYAAYYDDYSAITSTSTSNIVARTSTTTTTSTSSTTTTTSQPETCQLTLFSKTYNRGEELVLLDDSADLGSFSDIAISALVEGPCCWQLFGEVNFAGSSAWLRPGGDYKGTDSFG